MTGLTLSPVAPSEYERVAGIIVAPEHYKFAGPIAEAFEVAEEGVDFHAIFQGDTPVGFFNVDREYARKFPFAPPAALGLRAFIADKAHQGRGIATRAVAHLADYLPRHYPCAVELFLTVNKINPAAIQAYLRGGFQDTGTKWPHGDAGPQHVMRLALARGSSAT